jgi:transposase-like protein
MVIPDRTKNTLCPLMASEITAGSTVFTDSAAVYDGITGLGMDWVHRKTFVRYVLYRGHVYIVHTNRIDSLTHCLL